MPLFRRSTSAAGKARERFILLLIGLFGFVTFFSGVMANMFLFSDAHLASPYVAVTMASGETYFGRLSVWPRWKLMNPLVLQRTANAQTGTPQLVVIPLNRTFWQPLQELFINPREIATWSRLRDDSQLIRYIENPALLRNQPPTGFGD